MRCQVAPSKDTSPALVANQAVSAPAKSWNGDFGGNPISPSVCRVHERPSQPTDNTSSFPASHKRPRATPSSVASSIHRPGDEMGAHSAPSKRQTPLLISHREPSGANASSGNRAAPLLSQLTPGSASLPMCHAPPA